jgi:hypothetical protein
VAIKMVEAITLANTHVISGGTGLRHTHARHRGQRQQQGADYHCPLEKVMPPHAHHD